MKKIKVPSMWGAFVIFIFFTIFTSSSILFGLVYFLYQSGSINDPDRHPLIPAGMFLLLSMLIATGLNIFVGKKVLQPLSAFSLAMMEVAKGNFRFRLNYDGRIEELNEMSSNFNTMVHELGNIETLRNDFVVTVSHEFKTPLASIEGYATILQSPELTTEERKDCTQMIIESTKQLAKLSSNILMISNLENREIITEKTKFRLDEQIRQSVLMLEPFWEGKKIDFNIDLDHLDYYGNEELLMQVWLNIIGNAIKFTPKNSEISISLKEHANALTITISDAGIGLSAEDQKHIFDKFYQADRSGYTDGNGLGLSLVKRIIDLCHGEIIVQSELGLGTSFTITLPVKGS